MLIIFFKDGRITGDKVTEFNVDVFGGLLHMYVDSTYPPIALELIQKIMCNDVLIFENKK